MNGKFDLDVERFDFVGIPLRQAEGKFAVFEDTKEIIGKMKRELEMTKVRLGFSETEVDLLKSDKKALFERVADAEFEVNKAIKSNKKTLKAAITGWVVAAVFFLTSAGCVLFDK